MTDEVKDKIIELPASLSVRDLSEALFAAPLVGRLALLASFVGIGLLPVRLRQEFGLPWDARKERWLQWLARASRRLRPRLPELICVSPKALIAELRGR